MVILAKSSWCLLPGESRLKAIVSEISVEISGTMRNEYYMIRLQLVSSQCSTAQFNT